jgi:hypothetical protein
MSENSHRHLCDACLEKEYEAFRHARVHESMARNDAWLEKFNIGKWPRWDYDPEAETLRFSENGKTKVIADIVTAGLISQGSWEWSWGNPNITVRSREMMEKVREFGEEREWPKLTTLFVENDEHLGWEFSAISAHLLDAEGVYCCPLDKKAGVFAFVLAFNTRFVQ